MGASFFFNVYKGSRNFCIVNPLLFLIFWHAIGLALPNNKISF